MGERVAVTVGERAGGRHTWLRDRLCKHWPIPNYVGIAAVNSFLGIWVLVQFSAFFEWVSDGESSDFDPEGIRILIEMRISHWYFNVVPPNCISTLYFKIIIQIGISKLQIIYLKCSFKFVFQMFHVNVVVQHYILNVYCKSQICISRLYFNLVFQHLYVFHQQF